MTRWRGLLRSLAIPSLMLLFPLLAIKESLTWIFYLSPVEILAELSLRGIILLSLQAAAIGLWLVALAALKAFANPGERFDLVCRGLLTLTIIAASLRIALSNVEYMLLGTTTPGLFELGLVSLELFVVLVVGWKKSFLLLDELNRRYEPLLLAAPLLLIPVMFG